MKNKNIKTTLTFILVLLLLGILGFSYAYFQPILSSTGNENLVVSKDLRLMFDDESISEGEIYPGESYSKKFTVTNNGSSTLYYEIKWENYNNTFTNNEIHVELKCISYVNYTSGSKAVSGTCEGISDKAVTADTIKEGITITSGKTHEYEVILTFIETGTNQDYNKGKTFNGTLDVVENVLLSTNLNGGTLGQTLKNAYEIGEVVELSSPSKSGYVFSGWNVSGRRTTIDNNTLTIGDANATLTANYLEYANMYTYTGNSTVIDDSNGNWRIKFLTSGTFIPLVNLNIDVFLVGGGGGPGMYFGAGGGGGYTKTYTAISLSKNQSYPITIGLGGVQQGAHTVGSTGGSSTAFGCSASGGIGGNHGDNTVTYGGAGGSGGGGYTGAGGTDGSTGGLYGGIGQRTTTREFGETTGTLYAGGGGGYSGAGGAGGGGNGNQYGAPYSGTANTGGGAGGDNSSAVGGSGIVVIRNMKLNPVGDTTKYNFSYSGRYTIINGSTDNWKVKFLTSGTLIPLVDMEIDSFIVGAGGGPGTYYGSGGGGGYTKIQPAIALTKNQSYPITIGLGGISQGSKTMGLAGGSSSAFGFTAAGGLGGKTGNEVPAYGGDGGSGGAGGTGTGGTNGGRGSLYGGIGQMTTTREFGESTGDLYAGGGGGYNGPGGAGGGGNGSQYGTPNSGTANTGGGAGGDNSGAIGGDGVVVIRKMKINTVGNTTKYSFTYSGAYELVNENTDNWKIRFLTSGTLKLKSNITIDAFLVGGGGGPGMYFGGGGGGGYTNTSSSIALVKDQPYTIVIGAGGVQQGAKAIGSTGGTSSAFGFTASGGLGGKTGESSATYGGNGGSGGAGYTGTGGSNGGNGSLYAGIGQGTTTKEFGETTGTLYAGGGGGYSGPGGSGGGGNGNLYGYPFSGTPNTGGGSGGDNSSATGGSGIIIIRPHS